MKVFLDTNVWLSAIVFPGLCAELLAALMETSHELLSSGLVQAETHEVLRRKFLYHEEALALFDVLWMEATCLPDVDAPTDDADARLVLAATQGGTDLFVTGDQRVLAWGAQGEMRMLSPREAWDVLVTP